MATKNAPTANRKQRNQLIFVAIGAVVLIALVFIQGPKIWGKSSSSNPAPVTSPAATTAAGDTAASAVVAAPTLKGSAVIVKPAPRPGAKTSVAGVAVTPWQVPQASTGQLWTFSRLRVKDPFVQQVDEDQKITPVAPFAGSASGASTASSTPTTATSEPKASATKAAALPLAYATIEVNGNLVPLKLEQRFPASTKVFKLISVKPGSVVITLATGGSIGKGEDVVLKLGKSVTLVNSATGKRYTLSLLYTGSSPEVVQTFSTKKK